MATSMRHHVRRRGKGISKKATKMKRDSRQEYNLISDNNWKPYEMDFSAFADDEMGGFVGMEVLTDYDPRMLLKKTTITRTSGTKESSREMQTSKAEKKMKQGSIKSKTGNVGGSRAMKRASQTAVDAQQGSRGDRLPHSPAARQQTTEVGEGGKDEVTPSKTPHDVRGMRDGRNKKRRSGVDHLRELRRKRRRERSGERDAANAEPTPTDAVEDGTVDGRRDVAMSEWGALAVPTPVHQALQTMGFAGPTPIQAACINPAIKEGRDVVGAAETGSGKTLAFGIPLIYHILKHRAGLPSNENELGSLEEKGERMAESIDALEPSVDDESSVRTERPSDAGGDVSKDTDDGDDDDDDEGEEEEEEEEEEEDGEEDESHMLGTGCVNVIDNIDDDAWKKAGLPLAGPQPSGSSQGGKLFGLVLTPTRELAVQVKNHLVAAAMKTDIKVAVVVGGMSAEKQKRVLRKRPDIIVATPGRLWELYKMGEPHLSTLPDIRCLVIDEADRMVEKGHYAELSEILDLLNSSEQTQRQSFVFSATLSLIHLGPLRRSIKTPYKTDKKEKLESVMAKVGIKETALVVDLTKKEGTASTLLESKIVCEVEEKDVYLFYFLRQYPGRTLVFTNSIDCIRRLASILSLLQCRPLPLHSSMHQKQRLKNLERFTANPRGLLLATDVAARGLDIPDIEHVIHYQVPRTSESYVHRSGRTARQAKVGLSVTFVSPSELNFYRRLCKTLNREEIPSFPVEHRYYQAVRERVDLARDIDKLEHLISKKKHQNDWFVRAAKELDVDVDADMNLHDLGDSSEQKQFNKKMRMMKGHLNSLLKKKIFPSGASQLYLTSNGKLLSPFTQATIGAHEAASKLKARISTDKQDDSKQKEKKRKKFKRMGRYKNKAPQS
ncbi:ATP-dependent RNA helicase DDX24-like [Diadema antillarum]|uniref:ATP-dependent RNA helicase DDX24-like n=1 Tax=Diadema antillarum TaxID=105358 RepID=UPI003A8C5F82